MGKVNALVNSFTAGELTPRMSARVDTTKYRAGARRIKNFAVMAHGGVRKRGGSMFAAPVKAGADPVQADFQYNTEQTYLLEIGYAEGSGYIRFFTNGGILTETGQPITGATQANPCVVTVAGHGYGNGEWVLITGMSGGMTQLNNRHFKVANVTTDTFELQGIDASGYDPFSAGGSVGKIVEVATPYDDGEEADLTFTQSADVLYIAHGRYPTKKLSRLSAVTWTLTDAEFGAGPFRRINPDKDNVIGVGVLPWAASVSAITKADPCVVTTTAAHHLRSGASVVFGSVGGMTELNTNTYEVRVIDDTSFSLCDERGVPIDSSSYTTYTSGGTATQVDTVFATLSPGTIVTLEARKDTFVPEHVGAKWRLWEPGKGSGVQTPYATEGITDNAMYTRDSKVYGITNLTGTTEWEESWQYPDHDSGWVHVQDNSNSKKFDSVYLHDVSCVILITEYTSARVVHGYVAGKNHVPASIVGAATGTGVSTSGTYGDGVSNAQASRTAFHEEGAWSEHRGYPQLITGHEQRLWAAGALGDLQTIWASAAGDFEDFQDGTDDDRAVVYRVQSDKVEAPRWLSPAKILMMGTASGEFSITASGGRDEPITPANCRIVKQTRWGSAPGRVVGIGSSSLFLQRYGKPGNYARKVREFYYDFNTDAFVAPDMTILSEHLGNAQFVNATYQQDPDPIVWLHRADGTFVGLTYEKEQQVLGWHQHELAGPGAFVKHMRALPGDDGDDVWMIVEREINGETVRYHEILTSDDINTTAKEDSRYLDCLLTYDGAPTDTVTGLWHLEGETVRILADGAVHAQRTVINGRVSLSRQASKIHIGYSYLSELETLDLEAGAQMGTAHGRPKRISRVVSKFYRSLGGRVGVEGQMDLLPSRSSSDPMDASPPLFTGFYPISFPAGWEDEAIVRLEHDDPLPCNLMSFTVGQNVTG